MPNIRTLNIGIDFGTTFSFCGCLDEATDTVRPLVPSNEHWGIPSVFYDDGKTKLIGSSAAKRLLRPGTADKAVAGIKRRLAETGVILDAGAGHRYTAEQIVTEIIDYLVRCALTTASQQYLMDLDQANLQVNAVITVPVGFTEPMKQMVRRAASAVTLENGRHLSVSRLIPEPVAAARHYFGLIEHNADILVFDLGGGTFDAAWVRAEADNKRRREYKVIDQDGDPRLGGEDWDEAVANWIRDQFQQQYRETVTDRDMAYLKSEARTIKEELSGSVRYDTPLDLHGQVFDISLTREQFEQITKPLMDRVMDRLERLMRRQNRMPDHVVLTGGSSLMPQVQERIRQRFRGTDVRIVDPAHAIAFGAARISADPTPDTGVEVIRLISSHAYAVRYYNSQKKEKYLCVLIPRGVTLPYTGTTSSYTVAETDHSVFNVYEIDSEREIKEGDILPVSDGMEIMSARLDYGKTVPIGTTTIDCLILSEDELLTFRSVYEEGNPPVSTESSVSLKRNI